MFSEAAVVPFSGKTLRSHSTAGFQLTEKLFAPDRRNSNHAHANAYLEVTLEGEYVLYRGDQAHTCQPRTIVYHPAGEVHSNFVPANGVRILIVEIAPQELPWIRKCCQTAEDSLILEGGETSRFAARLYREFMNSDDVSPLVVEALALELLAGILRRRVEGSPKVAPEWLRRANELIRTRFADKLTLAEIAEQVGIHPVNLAQGYRHYYNCTVGNQIRQLRIEYASKQMVQTDSSLVEIALASGFSDQSHFTVAFKNYTGMTPSAYRHMQREANPSKHS